MIARDPLEGIYVSFESEDDLTSWIIWMEGPKDTPYEGGVFKLRMKFPADFPANPPSLYFLSEMWHPNVYPDGKVCISILHPPVEDEMSGEYVAERWNPTQSVESILLSVQSMLNDPNMYSPANTDAMVMCRDHHDQYLKRCKEVSQRGRASLPPNIVIPHPDTDMVQHKKQVSKILGSSMDLTASMGFGDLDLDDNEEIEYDEDGNPI